MFNLTINAVPASTIIVGRRATWLDRHAAEELRDYVKKISGTILNIADETLTMAVTGNRILIGRPSTSDLVKNFADQNPGILPAESDTENDCLAIVQRGEVLVLSGSNDRSVYYSVCHLLQTVFHVGFYWDRDVYEANPDMTVPDNLTIVERSAFKFRHTIGQWVYNHGAFLNEAERREELDKYARNKINSYRLYSWNSYARKMTFIKLGVPGIEIKPEDIARRDIIRDTIEYAQALGIDIMVTLPPDEMTQDFHKLYPNARYFGSEWVKDDNAAPQTKPCLYPEDPMFKTFFQTFVKVWIEEYGPVHNFVASPPCESHISTTIDDYINISVNYSKYTYEAVHELVPEARVFFDGWGVRANTPPCIWTMPGVMQRFVDAMPDEVYMLDLWPNRKETDATFRDPMYRDANYSPLRKAHYVLEALNEFGGDDHMHGDFARHIEAAKEMTDPSIVEHGDGFGNCTELCGVSLHFFDLIFQLAWNPKDITVQSFLEDSAKRRYGGLAPEIGVKAMQARGGGSIINISSIHSLMSQPTNMLYAGTKGAMNAAARVMALDYAKDNIRVNTICPGVVISDVMYDDMDKLDDAGKKQLDAALHRCQPLEPGRMQDIANTALFFASNMSANITGQTLLSDGGTSIKAHDMDC